MPALNKAFRGCTVPRAHSVFRDHCVNLNKRYPVVTQDQLHQEAGGKLNPYGFFKAFLIPAGRKKSSCWAMDLHA